MHIELAMDLYETEPFWRSQKHPMCWVAHNLDKGRDGMHWGPKLTQTHQLVSNHFAKLIGEDT